MKRYDIQQKITIIDGQKESIENQIKKVYELLDTLIIDKYHMALKLDDLKEQLATSRK
jgi:hypothetical protein